MIQSKADLREYMEADRIHLGYEYKKPKIRDIVWRCNHRGKDFVRRCRMIMSVKGKHGSIVISFLRSV